MKADLHLHSRHSDRPSEWFLRRIGAPESFVDPLQAYRTCRDRGMDFVTLTDHNSIEGALQIAHLPDTFLSVEITTYFPEDGCKIHCLAHGIREAHFAEIQKVRENIYDLRHFLSEAGIAHSIAHPLFRVNGKLTVDHVEKLLLLFHCFERINGTRNDRNTLLIESIFNSLTPEIMNAMAERQNVEPQGETPWQKCFTGGSDDHSGVYAAAAYTETPPGSTVNEFIDHLRAGHHAPGGISGTSLRLAHSLYHIAGDYYAHRFETSGGGSPILAALLHRMADTRPRSDTPPTGRLRSVVRHVVRRYRIHRMSATERGLIEALEPLMRSSNPATDGRVAPLATSPSPEDTPDRRVFNVACRIGQKLGYAFLCQCLEQIAKGRLIESLQAVSSLGPVALSLAPYFAAFATQHRDEPFLQSLAQRFPNAEPYRLRSRKRAWFTDTFNEVNGVAFSIRTLADRLTRQGKPVRVVTSLEQAAPPSENVDCVNFPPLGQFTVPEYEELKLSFPPFLEIFEYLERERFGEVLISTPGPLGLTALAAARLLGIKATGLYHTDFPRYVSCLTGDDSLESGVWKAMLAFYGQMDRVYVPSRSYLDQLSKHGFEREKLHVLPRGVDTERFNPSKRHPQTLERYGLNGGFKYLYVGRISREKNLQILLDAFCALPPDTRVNRDLLLVGDGPDRKRLEDRYADPHIVFTGYLHGEDLARAYASSDTFVFPSATDTFGNVVLEAQASGLPVIVTDQGGPSDIVSNHASGLVVPAGAVEPLSAAMHQLAEDRNLRTELSRRALQNANDYNWDVALAEF